MEIGEKVYWTIGNKKRTGIFKQIIDNKAQVVCIDIDGIPVAIKTEVELTLLKKQ